MASVYVAQQLLLTYTLTYARRNTSYGKDRQDYYMNLVATITHCWAQRLRERAHAQQTCTHTFIFTHAYIMSHATTQSYV